VTTKPLSMRDAMRQAFPRKPKPEEPAAPAPAPKARRVRPPRPLRPVDALLRIPLLAERRGSAIALPATTLPDGLAGPADKLVTRPGRPAARGWREVAARFEAVTGGRIALTPDGTEAVLLTPGGAGDVDLLYSWERVARWVAAGMRGEPWTCPWCDREALTLLPGLVPWCASDGCAPDAWVRG